jgi:ethanolamine transporter EutH
VQIWSGFAVLLASVFAVVIFIARQPRQPALDLDKLRQALNISQDAAAQASAAAT